MRAVKIKQRLLVSANYVNVGWAMIIGVNHHTERSDSRYGRHCTMEPKRLGLSVLWTMLSKVLRIMVLRVFSRNS
jgi:hypothetical protein